jgi:hypothetical protein
VDLREGLVACGLEIVAREHLGDLLDLLKDKHVGFARGQPLEHVW